MEIEQIENDAEKYKITVQILSALPEWFEIPESREKYAKESAGKMFFCAKENQQIAGFLYLSATGADTVELAVTGVLKSFHRKGIGKALFSAAKNRAAKAGYSFIQVKTVKTGVYPEYDKTNLFYKSLGFKEFEIMPGFWNEENPCQIYVMSLK
ncbi:MAG: GNAT family N-acetyltransferase [Treponemataceae bacterium]|nr:GNAT family N-acetyltransferase [Treponemataceae bacterium]